MRRTVLSVGIGVLAVAFAGMVGWAEQNGPYKVLRTAKVGGEGGWDYIFADTADRRLYIPRGATQAQPSTDTKPAVEAFEKRLTIFNLDKIGRAHV